MSLGCTSCIRSKSGQAACAIALAQGQQCLHRSDESAAERLRRQAAVKFVGREHCSGASTESDRQVRVLGRLSAGRCRATRIRVTGYASTTGAI